MQRYHTVLTIAGSDSGGGAGIQADLKAIGACGCYGTSAITALTAQNTLGVSAIHPVPVGFIEQQIRSVLDDIGADAVKIGMLHSPEVITCVAGLLAEYQIPHVVLDPVMVATSGDRLIQDDAVTALQELLFPLATLVTPNVHELQILSGHVIASEETLGQAARDLGNRFQLSVLAKAGHLSGEQLSDLLFDQTSQTLIPFTHQRLHTRNTHGTGCTLSSAIAAHLAKGIPLVAAIDQAITYLHRALRAGSSYRLGSGHGPVHHFHGWWR
ncbi:bifunctional hydroxymethylpyrimidine kinase/phosphomethylpyrimidine kinase [Desulfofustis limnaeus]|jgi:hydroxymethylpyrimidine/phosphomethylpyrimidine kinase|uniref:hydroxymethylpyrimidine kinase n=1 Tax=Desulfofustis limnaeus TaxID=2740163 RepID=A0ABN6M7B5_9BACT|nr:bifunctional hydroxymethylpyrimidine kinase/phosphomethylpyrimidine kinase [Desulfofustis limnaeus]MDX9894870.1 bifunctional hydroxymethylpyrimidine kinase/phosphomethylpyrimidine kinase [Desulfofustis sp.]BDD87463.1 hydroxymethylpyrimidine/phosphomethylpyrimidine kinase [Desulfofustis limnaeus]